MISHFDRMLPLKLTTIILIRQIEQRLRALHKQMFENVMIDG
jgi:hypothetical protein